MDAIETIEKTDVPEEAANSRYHRHTNPDGTPGGLIENTASVAPTAYVGPEAVVEGNSSVAGGSEIRDKAQVIDADIGEHVVLEGQAKAIGGAFREETLRDEVVLRWNRRQSPAHPRINLSIGSPRSR